MEKQNGKQVMQKTDITDRLKAYAEVTEMLGQYTESNCMHEAIEEIQRLRQLQQDLIVAFKVNMMKNCKEYSHKEFDNKIEEILNG